VTPKTYKLTNLLGQTTAGAVIEADKGAKTVTRIESFEDKHPL
jgi:hypothetical protein